MGDALPAMLLLVVILVIPGGAWYFIVRKIVRGRRAAREVLALGATLTQEQAEEFDRSLLPQARNIFEQLELMVKYVQEIDESEGKGSVVQSGDNSGANTVTAPSNREPNGGDSVVQELERLASLFQQNLLTEAEYTRLKSQLIE